MKKLSRKIATPVIGIIGGLSFVSGVVLLAIFKESNSTLRKWRIQSEGKWKEDDED